MTTITLPRATVEQALEALEMAKINGRAGLLPAEIEEIADAIAALRGALAQQAEPVEPVAWVHTDAHNPKVRFLEWTQQAKGYRGDWIKTPLCNCAQPRQSDPQIEDRLARHGIPKP